MTRSPPEEAQLHSPARLPACPPQLGFLTFLELYFCQIVWIVFLPNHICCAGASWGEIWSLPGNQGNSFPFEFYLFASFKLNLLSNHICCDEIWRRRSWTDWPDRLWVSCGLLPVTGQLYCTALYTVTACYTVLNTVTACYTVLYCTLTLHCTVLFTVLYTVTAHLARSHESIEGGQLGIGRKGQPTPENGWPASTMRRCRRHPEYNTNLSLHCAKLSFLSWQILSKTVICHLFTGKHPFNYKPFLDKHQNTWVMPSDQL